MDRIVQSIVAPTYAAMAREGLSYAGVLYFGLMITADGPRVLEFNVRFGDPETQVLLPLVDAEFGELVEALATGTLEKRFGQRRAELGRASQGGRPGAALGVVIAGRGYPDGASARVTVEDLPERLPSDTLLFHASTARDGDGRVTVGGGRCFTVVGIGRDLPEAAARAYASVPLVRFPGGWSRSDIGRKLMEARP
jgi:phosphoribosylamine-glycine ligase